jgi:hypothetical protein
MIALEVQLLHLELLNFFYFRLRIKLRAFKLIVNFTFHLEHRDPKTASKTL